MQCLKSLLVTASFLALMLNNLVWAEEGGDGGDFDGSDHQDDDSHHHHPDHHHNFIIGFGGYYDPWLWGGYYTPGLWGGNYYNPGLYSPGLYGYRTFGYADPFFRPYDAYPSAGVAPSRSPVYIQKQAPRATQLEAHYWHYCKDPAGYYPYIKECPSGWLRVAPQPSAQ